MQAKWNSSKRVASLFRGVRLPTVGISAICVMLLVVLTHWQALSSEELSSLIAQAETWLGLAIMGFLWLLLFATVVLAVYSAVKLRRRRFYRSNEQIEFFVDGVVAGFCAPQERKWETWLGHRSKVLDQPGHGRGTVLGRMAADMTPSEFEDFGRFEAFVRHAVASVEAEAAGTIDGLNLVTSLAPQLGFLGTLVGMVEAFENLSLFGDRGSGNALAGNMRDLAEAIRIALITSVFGISVKVIASIVYSKLVQWLNGGLKPINEMPQAVVRLIFFQMHVAGNERVAAARQVLSGLSEEERVAVLGE